MKGSQKVVLVSSGPEGVSGLTEVNEYLRAGWRVAEVAPMGGGGASEHCATLVVLERVGTAESVLEALEEEIEEAADGDAGDLPAGSLGLGTGNGE